MQSKTQSIQRSSQELMQQTLELQKQTDVMRDQMTEQYKYDNIKQAAEKQGMKPQDSGSDLIFKPASQPNNQMIQRNLRFGNPPAGLASIAIFRFTQISLFKTSTAGWTAYHENRTKRSVFTEARRGSIFDQQGKP